MPRPEMEVWFLPDNFSAELERPGVERAGDLTKAALGAAVSIESLEAVTDIVELRVVEGVERLEAKLETSPSL